MNKYTDNEIRQMATRRNIIYALAAMQNIVSGISMGLAINSVSHKQLTLALIYGAASAYCFTRGWQYMNHASKISRELNKMRNDNSR